MGELIFFHSAEDTPPPQRFWRRWARAEIAAVRARRIDNGETGAVPKHRLEVNSEPLRPCPVIMTDEERGQGDSTNAKMHKLLRGNNG